MGKASRRQRQSQQRESGAVRVAPAPYVARPFAGLPAESDWVALREIVPAATMEVSLRPDAGPLLDAAEAGGRAVPGTVSVATVLPMALPGLHRTNGDVVLALQTGTATGDASRDLAHALLGLLASEPGASFTVTKPADAATPRLQDLVDGAAACDVRMYDGFDFWVPDEAQLDAAGRQSLDAANESLIPTVKLTAAPSAYWCRVGDRTHLRWVLPHDEDVATDALARLRARGDDALGPDTRFLGAFRACGLIAPVWDLDPALEADAYEEPLAAFAATFEESLSRTQPLDAAERRARAGLVGRQLTLR